MSDVRMTPGKVTPRALAENAVAYHHARYLALPWYGRLWWNVKWEAYTAWAYVKEGWRR